MIALDLRGHGKSEGKAGDIRYIGQYEDDVADVIAALRLQKPGSRIILLGHSMGGGIAMRYAATHEAPAADAYLLFAPHLGVKSATTRTEPPQGHASEGEAPLKLHLPRTIGLIILNAARVRWLNGLDTPVLQRSGAVSHSRLHLPGHGQHDTEGSRGGNDR